jgi:coenzyme F420-0:L-glutamate ligase/coenzyme F420-1:gamma-L-glutamate ligase
VTLSLIPLEGFPLIQPGDDLVELISASLKTNDLSLEDGDILVVTQKIVSKAENRLVNLTQVQPSEEAHYYASLTAKDPRLIELILSESQEVLRTRHHLIIVVHNHGFVCANAGIDHSNVSGPWGQPEDWVLLLPEDPARSADQIKRGLEEKTDRQIGVLIIDSHGRAWRRGTVGVTIGLSGVPGLVDMRGENDLFDWKLRSTYIGAGDELAAGASLVMGQAGEGFPVVLARGFPYSLREARLKELIRAKKRDLFR